MLKNMFKRILKTTFISTSACALVIGNMHLRNSNLFTPKDYDFTLKKDKKIVVVGAGIIGLTTAYCLA